MSTRKPHKSSKTIFTATNRSAIYLGTHPHLVDTNGVYYFSTKQNAYLYRPTGEGKLDWYRVHKENLVDTQETGNNL